MKAKRRKAGELKRAVYNPRFIGSKERAALKASLERFGMVKPIIININPKRKNIVIGGHQRLEIWEELGNEYIYCIELNLSEEEERELNIRLNKNGGGFDYELLSANFEIEELKDWGFESFELGEFEDTMEEEQLQEEKKEEGEQIELGEKSGRNKEESELQIRCVKWFREEYPKYSKALFSVPNGGTRHKLEAVTLKAEGVTAGVSDLVLAVPDKYTNGAFIEMKTSKGRLSDEQKEFLDLMQELCYTAVVVRTFDQFKEVVNKQMKEVLKK